MTHEKPYTIVSSQYLWRSRWYSLRQDRLRAPDGNEVTYTVVDKPGAVWVVPVTAEGQMVLIDQYRYPVDAWCLEVPAGNCEADSVLTDAARELSEEVGGTAARIEPITDFYTMNGIGNEFASVTLAHGVTLGASRREPTEHITLQLVPVRQALEMARHGQIKDGPSALAILLCEAALAPYLERTS